MYPRNEYASMARYNEPQLDSLGGGKSCNSPLGCNPLDTLKGIFSRNKGDSGPIPPMNYLPPNMVMDALGIAMDSRGLPTPLRIAKHLGGKVLDSLSQDMPTPSMPKSPMALFNYHPANVAMDALNIGSQYRDRPPPVRAANALLNMLSNAFSKAQAQQRPSRNPYLPY